MNFLLDILGRAQRAAPIGRMGGLDGVAGPGDPGLWSVRKALLAGDFERAADLLEQTAGDAVWALLGRGQLRLISGGYEEAAWCFAQGMERLMGATDGSLDVGSGSPLERMIAAAEASLRTGRCGQSAALFGQARGMVDELLAAETGLCVAEGRLAGHLRAGRVERLAPLARLGDVLLKTEARARLASGVAQVHGRADALATSAGGGKITELLEGEYESLAAYAGRLRGHAELHLRLGLLARALGRHEAAAWALGEVLRAHPHHVAAAGRLGATLVERGEPGVTVMAVLAVALAVPRETLRQYDALAAASRETAFDDRVRDFTGGDGGVVRRANLAFALGELGMLDGSRTEWRELVRA